jgi:hypothetical protein
MYVMEDRATGERRRVPAKYLFLANNRKDIAFEMVPAAEGSTAEDEE